MKHVDLGSAVRKISFCETDGRVGAITENGSFFVLNDELKKVAGFKTNYAQENGFRHTQFISYDLRYIALCKQKTNQAVIMDTVNKKVLYAASKNSGEIETIYIDVQNKYLVTGGMDGRTYMYDLKTGHFLYNLPSHADYVTAITMTNTTQLIATGSFDGKISVTNINTLKNAIKLLGHNAAIIGIEFLNKGKLVSADKNGGLIIFDFNQQKIHKRLESSPDEITAIKVDPNRDFLFVGSKLGRISVYDLKTESLLTHSLHKFSSPITDISIAKNNLLIVGFKSGMIFKNKLIDEEKYMKMYDAGEYAGIYKELEKSPFVIFSLAYEKVESKWEASFQIAKDYLADRKNEEAKTILIPFESVPKKKTLIRMLLNDFEEFNKFKSLVEMRRFALAYSLVLKYPLLEETKEYRMMENEWKRNFNKAQDIILDPRSDSAVSELFKDFKGIPSKTKQIQQLMKDKTIFNMFKKRTDAKNYKEVLALANQYPFLKELDAYKQFLKIANAAQVSLTKAMASLDYSKAREYIGLLESFEEYAQSAEEAKRELSLLIQLTGYCQSNDIKKLFEITDSLNYEIELDCIKKLQAKWNATLDHANSLAAKGDVVGVINSFGEYFKIDSKSDLIKKTILSAYRKKIEYFMQKAGKEDERTKLSIKNKILSLENLLGTTEELVSLDLAFKMFYGELVGLDGDKREKEVSREKYEEYFSPVK